MEVWKQLNIPEGYFISSHGRLKSVYSKDPNKILKVPVDRYGYNRISIKGKNYRIHRLVAAAFIENPDSKMYVNHINGIKTDNGVENLEWVTAKENKQHAIKTGLSDPKAPWSEQQRADHRKKELQRVNENARRRASQENNPWSGREFGEMPYMEE